MFDSPETYISNPYTPIRTKVSMYYILFCSGIAICLLFLATGWIPWNPFGYQRDPLKQPLNLPCPSFMTIKSFSKYEFPPPNPNPHLNMHEDYPSPPPGLWYPPLIGDVSVVVQFDYELGNWVGSPSILKWNDNTWIASMDVKVVSDENDASAWNTQIFVSHDQGKTWHRTAAIEVGHEPFR